MYGRNIIYNHFKFNGNKFLQRYYWNKVTQKSEITSLNKEQFKRTVYDVKAVQWFRNNLGSAILKGKILAIPVIEIN